VFAFRRTLRDFARGGFDACQRRIKSGTTLLVAGVLLATATPAAAREVRVPLHLDHAFLRRLIIQQVYTGPGQTAQVFADQAGCNLLTLRDPEVDAGGEGRIRVKSRAEARIGAAVGGSCLNVLDWKGKVELLEIAELDPSLAVVRFRIVDSNVYDEADQKRATGTLWDWVKQHVHPRLEAVTVDLHEPLGEMRAFLPLVLPHEEASRLETLLDSVALADVGAEESGLRVDLRFDVADATPAAPQPEPTLTAEELERWQRNWQSWDAFLTFVVKQAAADTGEEERRRDLLTVLIDARYELAEALAPTAASDEDPVRRLFVDVWPKLGPVLRGLTTNLPGEEALHYLSFLAAGDALRALDELGPGVGVEISADGLRRLARMVAPTSTEDPVSYSLDVDPALRARFGFGDPLPIEDDDGASWLDWFVSRAWAAEDPLAGPLAKLRRWAPTRADLPVYLPLVRELLGSTSERITTSGKVDDSRHALFRWLLLATAWQESCWRQFIRRDGQVVPIASGVGAVGLMQVNQRVWRGFYDLSALRDSIAYNARAGGEILAMYLGDYAVAKGEHKAPGGSDNLARATYAAYNGGPGHLKRYRSKSTKRSLRAIDESFWKKYRAVKEGEELGVAECFGQ
jgi:hypothetical protein